MDNANIKTIIEQTIPVLKITGYDFYISDKVAVRFNDEENITKELTIARLKNALATHNKVL
jgi:hypothetical protein